MREEEDPGQPGVTEGGRLVAFSQGHYFMKEAYMGCGHLCYKTRIKGALQNK